MPRQQQQQPMDVARAAVGDEELVNGVGDGDEVMEEDHQEGYGA